MWFKLEFVMRFQIKIKIVKFIKKTHKNKANLLNRYKEL